MKKICFVTATRAEYGLLKWIMKDVASSGSFELQLIVTGAHLLKEQGYTVDTIVDDGFRIDEIVDISLDPSSDVSIAASMGRMGEEFAKIFERICPDYVAVLGDRYELLPIVSTAFVMNIPIIHFSGGDITEGAIDDGIRNAVTMLSTYHFPGTCESADRIARMRNSDKKIWAVGEPGLDSFYREQLLNREELSENIGLDLESEWCLFTYHPETRQSIDYNLDAVRNCVECLLEYEKLQVIATYANTDVGGNGINDYLNKVAKEKHGKFIVIPSLGNLRYLSLMKQVVFVIGNSSSGIIEAPVLGTPVINVGGRQRGRHLCENIIQSDANKDSINISINNALHVNKYSSDNYWGDGHTAEKALNILIRELI